jgi:hypothetical protein
MTGQMLHVLPDGEYDVIKKTKYGIWVRVGTSKVFINYSDTFTDPDTWGEAQDDQP